MSLDDLFRLADEVPERYRALILLAGLLRPRWSEAIGLTVDNIHFLNRTLEVSETIAQVDGRLSVEATKTEPSHRSLAILEPLVDELARHLATFRPGTAPESGSKTCVHRVEGHAAAPVVRGPGVQASSEAGQGRPGADVPRSSQGGDELHGRRQGPSPHQPPPPGTRHCQAVAGAVRQGVRRRRPRRRHPLWGTVSSATGTKRARNPKID